MRVNQNLITYPETHLLMSHIWLVRIVDMPRSQLGEHRPDYTFTCGICGKEIRGKSNTIHLGVRSHVISEFKQGKRKEPYTSPREYGDGGRKFV